MRKAGRAIAAAVPGILLPNTIQRRVVNLDASDFGFAFYNISKTFDASLEFKWSSSIDPST
jgi:hypothetical protein